MAVGRQAVAWVGERERGGGWGGAELVHARVTCICTCVRRTLNRPLRDMSFVWEMKLGVTKMPPPLP